MFVAFILSFFGMKALKRNDRLIYLEVLGDLERFDQQAALTRRFPHKLSNIPIQKSQLELNSVQDT